MGKINPIGAKTPPQHVITSSGSKTNRRQFLATTFLAIATGGGALLAGAASNPTGELNRPEIDNLRSYSPGKDFKSQEAKWAEAVWPTVKHRLIRLFEAEKLDNEELNKGLITQKDRRVKIAYTNFVLPQERGNDGDLGPSFHVVKRYDDKQKDGTILRTYVNESWPLTISERKEKTTLDIGILPPESIRIRVQVFPGDITKPGAEDLFVTDYLQAIWGIDAGGVIGGYGNIFPKFARQHLYGDQIEIEEEKINLQNQVFVPVSSPLKCASCHRSQAIFTQDIFLKPGEKKTNYGAITPDEEFSDKKDLQRQLGYKQLESYLNELSKTNLVDRSLQGAILGSLRDSTNVELPYIVETIKSSDNIPWLDSDKEPNYSKLVDSGFVYKNKAGSFEKAMADYYRDEIYFGTWWKRNDLVLIPR